MEQNNQSSHTDTKPSEKRGNRIVGIIWLIAPFILLISVLTLYTISAFVINTTMSTADESLSSLVGSIIDMVLSLLGILAIISIPFGMAMFIRSFRKQEIDPTEIYDERSGNKDHSVIPEEIKKWSWGAFGLTWIWGVYHGIWISLLAMIPVVGIIMMIILGIKGNEMAWRSYKWKSVEEFQTSQNKWKSWGIAFFILHILAILLQ